MSALLEQPLFVLFLGSLLVGVSALVWQQTQHPRAFYLFIASVGLLIGGLALEHVVVTPAEEVEAQLQAVARALETNDLAQVTQFLSPSAVDVRADVKKYLHLVKVRKISLKNNLIVTVNASGQAAEAKFNAVASLAGADGTAAIPRFLVVQYQRENGQWLVTSYQDFDPRGENVPARP